MLIEFDKMETTVIPHMRGGEKEVSAQMYTDSLGKIMRGTLIPGASIGLHTHETSSEIIYILSGTGPASLCPPEAATIARRGMSTASLTTALRVGRTWCFLPWCRSSDDSPRSLYPAELRKHETAG